MLLHGLRDRVFHPMLVPAVADRAAAQHRCRFGGQRPQPVDIHFLSFSFTFQ